VSSRERQALLASISALTLLVGFALGTATAEPKTELQKNQILFEDATCTTDGQGPTSYTFVINGMAKTGHLVDSTDKTIKITSYTVTYYDAEGNELGTDAFGSGTKKNPRDDILSCSGQVTTDLEGIGDDVTAVYDFRAFLAPG
jgi:pyruvate dehydrogenase complex dehydrogenase (E1) component